MSTWLPDTEVSVGKIIKAEHFNTMLRRLKDFWVGDLYTYTSDHTENDPIPADVPFRRHGWGQPNILPAEVSVGQIITAEHINHLIVVLNVAIFHIDKTDLPPMAKITFNYDNDPYGTPTNSIATVDMSYYTLIMTKMDQIENAKYDADNISIITDVALVETTQGFTWSDDLYCILGATFNDYNEARHYFNSGGVITFELECGGASGGSIPKWEQFFHLIGEIRIGADSSTTTGFLQNTIINGGFYNIDFGTDWTTIFEIAGQQFINSEYGPGGEYAGEYGRGEYAGEYGNVYSLGEYDSRRVRVQGRIIEDINEYRIELRIILLEDAEDDLLPIQNTISVTVGYLEILDTPTLSDYTSITGLEQYFTFKDNPSYKFEAKQSPTVSIVQQWTSEDL